MRSSTAHRSIRWLVFLAPLLALTNCAADPDSGFPVTHADGQPTGNLVADFAEHATQSELQFDRSAYDFSGAHSDDHHLEGWADPETTSGGRTFAWATGRMASLTLEAYNSTDQWLHFRSRPYAPAGRRQSALLTINGHDVTRVVFSRGGFQDYSFQIPPDVLTAGENTISFEFESVAAPADVDPANDDSRPLAAAFEAIAITGSGDPPSRQTREQLSARYQSDGRIISQPSGVASSFRVRVPVNATLEFGLRPGESASPDESVSAELLIRMAGNEEVIFSEPVEGESERWSADLSAAEGWEVDVVLRARDDTGSDTFVEWVEPRLFGDLDVTTNVVLIVVDTLRADHVGRYGERAHTPTLDALADSGIRFNRAYSHVPITLPSHSSMFTSLLPSEHGALTNGATLREEHLTLPELLREARRRTAAFISLGVLGSHFGIGQGFDEYHDDFGLNWWHTAADVNARVIPWLEQQASEPFFLWAHYSDPHEPYGAPNRTYTSVQATVAGRIAASFDANGGMVSLPLDVPPGNTQLTLSRVRDPERDQDDEIEWPLRINQLRTSTRAVTTACTRGCSTHHPRPEATEYRTDLPATLQLENSSDATIPVTVAMRVAEHTSMRTLRERYRGEVEYVDEKIGELLATVMTVTKEDTLIIFTSDHGEGLGEHGAPGHVPRLYDTELRVPLIFSWPERLATGAVVDAPVSHIDILPTVLDLLGIRAHAHRSGRSLVRLMEREEQPESSQPIIAATYRPEAPKDRTAIIADGYKLISTPIDDSEELFDLSEDPWERKNLAEERRDTRSRLRRLLFERMAEAEQRASSPVEGTLTEEQVERLRSLGYVR